LPLERFSIGLNSRQLTSSAGFLILEHMPRNTYYRSAHWKALREMALKHYGRRCSVPGCHGTQGLTVDHRSTRPNSDHPTAADTLANLRVLCKSCDSKVKELANGRRRNGGLLPGADHRGFPVDPLSHWYRS
jgi:hypothetical protein